MAVQVRVFIDYWNFQLNWNERAGTARCDWLALPWALMESVGTVVRQRSLSYEGTHVYASADSDNGNLTSWLSGFLGRQPGFAVSVVPMLRRVKPVRCSACGHSAERCPECQEVYALGSAKGLTTGMVVDLMRLSAGGRCDIPVVVTTDTELLPAVNALVSDGVKVLYAGWKDTGPELARSAWGCLELDELMEGLVRA